MYTNIATIKKVSKPLKNTFFLFKTYGIWNSKKNNQHKVKLFFRSQREGNKALFHQKGLGKLPERKFFGFSKANEKAIQREFAKFIKKQMKKCQQRNNKHTKNNKSNSKIQSYLLNKA